ELKPGQRAAIVILLYYHDLKAEARIREYSGKKIDPTEKIQEGSAGEVAEIIGDKVGMTGRNVYNLLAVYRNRLDLFYRVRDGEIAIGRAYQQMKDDEKPEEVAEEVTPADALKRDIERMIEDDSTQPQYDESEHEL